MRKSEAINLMFIAGIAILTFILGLVFGQGTSNSPRCELAERVPVAGVPGEYFEILRCEMPPNWKLELPTDTIYVTTPVTPTGVIT